VVGVRPRVVGIAGPDHGRATDSLTRYLRLRLAAVLEGSLVKVISWYDNEWSYSNRYLELAQRVPVRAHA
jgi:glyceraldehyde-3-phosphate dehydrogenase/erythrose-4-phosphate dehydrogenase